MISDLKSAKSDLDRLNRELKTTDTLNTLTYGSALERMDRALNPIRRPYQDMQRALFTPGEMARTHLLANANFHYQELIGRATGVKSFAELLTNTHHSWLERTKPFQLNELNLQASAALTLCNTSIQLAAAERIIERTEFNMIKTRLQIESTFATNLESSIEHMANSYSCLAESIHKFSDITRLPSFVFLGATREIFANSYAIGIFNPHSDQHDEEIETEIQLVEEAENDVSDCIPLLQQFDPEIANMYIGAQNALYGNNIDRDRHMLISLRELWNHLLRRLAPNDDVNDWISKLPNQSDLRHNDKPTRRARILCICREINHDQLTGFVVDDTRALLNLFEFFNRVHKLSIGLTDQQLRAILFRSNSWLTYVLRISNWHNN